MNDLIGLIAPFLALGAIIFVIVGAAGLANRLTRKRMKRPIQWDNPEDRP